MLPRSQRLTDSLQTEGSPPTVRKVPGAELGSASVAAAEDLMHKHEGGSVAIITMHSHPMRSQLVKRGWSQDRPDEPWRRGDGRTLWLLSSEAARGLEFDAVVVVEPADFPPNLGRLGQLYTSLTRANRELVVLHAQSLPRVLKAKL